MSIRNSALVAYTEYMEHKQSWSKYDSVWERLMDSVADGDKTAVANIVREACVRMFEEGLALRLTEGEQ